MSMEDPEIRAESARESRLRRLAKKYDLRLVKSRSRNPAAIDYGLYAIIDIYTGGTINRPIVDRWICSWDLDDVEAYLTDDKA